MKKHIKEPIKIREESANYFDKYQDLSYNVNTMKTIEHKEETILEECRRIRKQLSAEYAKDPKKYMDNLYKRQEQWKAEGVKFAPIPPTPRWIKEYLKICRDRQAAEEAAKKKTPKQ